MASLSAGPQSLLPQGIKDWLPDWQRALALGLAAWGAFAVATALGISHAFWAAMPIWVLAQPFRGATLERAVWRLAGTVIGGAAGLVILTLAPAPWVTALALSAAMALFAALGHLWSGVRSYMPLMCAITLCVVVLPEMLSPAGSLHLALDRLACTVIGGLAVVLIVAPLTPRADTPGFRVAGQALADRFADTAGLMLSQGVSEDDLDRATAEVIHQGAALEARARLVAAGSPDGYRRMAALDAILAAGLSLLEAATTARSTPALRDTALSMLSRDEIPEDTSAPVLVRLGRARRALQAAAQQLQEVSPSGRRLRRLVPPQDPGLAARAALLAGGGGLAGTMLYIATGSFTAELTAFSIIIFSLVLGSMPRPRDIAPKLIVGVLIGALAGVVYRIGVQPYVDGWGSLVLTLAPFIALGALGRSAPRTAPYALDANMCFMLASQAGGAVAAPLAIVGSGAAMVIGTFAVVCCIMTLPRPGMRLIAETERRLDRELSQLSDASLSPQRWSAIWGRRLLTLAGKLDGAGQDLPRRLLTGVALGRDQLDQRHKQG